MGITQTDKSGGGVSQRITSEERKRRGKGFHYPSHLWLGKSIITAWISICIDKHTQRYIYTTRDTNNFISVIIMSRGVSLQKSCVIFTIEIKRDIKC